MQIYQLAGDWDVREVKSSMYYEVGAPSLDILSILRSACSASGRATAIMDLNGRRTNFDELKEKAERIACYIAGVNGKTGRPRIGIVLPNGMEMAISLLGVTCAGTALPFNPAYRKAEFEAYFATTKIDALLVADHDDGDAVKSAQEHGIPILRLLESGSIDGVTNPATSVPQTSPEDVALVLLTSGSTGRAKSVPLTHRNVCRSAGDVAKSLNLSETDICLAMWEQFHVGGLVDLLLAPLISRGTLICTSGFNAEIFFDVLPKFSPTWFQGVPTTLNELVIFAKRNSVSIKPHSLRLLRSVAAALPSQLMHDLEAMFDVPIIQTFGMTEAGPLITSTALPPAIRKPGSVGRSCGPQIQILGSNGEALPSPQIGEVAIQGDNVFSGYENDTEANANQFRSGWFLTGDLGYLDQDGDLFLTGRIKQLINRGGEKVNPQELDDAIMNHPTVAQAASYAIPHRTLGEDVAMAVVLYDGQRTTPDELRNFLRKSLANFKVPSHIKIVDSLPRNLIGKIDRMALTQLHESRVESSTITTMGDIESRIARIWARELELKLERINAEANFFELGGDSLSAVRVFLAIETEFERKLPETTLDTISSIRAMAQVVIDAPLKITSTEVTTDTGKLLSKTQTRSLASVMALGSIPVAHLGSAMKVCNRSGSKTPLFWCFNSPAKEMNSLATKLDTDQPLYGLYSGGRLFPPTDDMLEGVAQHYASEILTLDPFGPCYIGGNCRGGWIAERLERLLTAAGKPVLGIILLEHSSMGLSFFPGRVLLMFGKQSNLRAYRAINWLNPGWEESFSGHIESTWVHGGHAEFFQPGNVETVAAAINSFLSGQQVTAQNNNESLLNIIHKIPGALEIYRALYKVREGRLFRRKRRVNPFTGEPDR